jgi:hypothetical protein
VFAALVLGAAVAGRSAITDPLAMIAVYARVVQSTVHLISTSEIAVMIRATFWTVQVVIMIGWALRLLLG